MHNRDRPEPTELTELTDFWLARPRPRPSAPIKLLCLHHAGGNPSNFRPWLDALPDDVELLAVRLAGREARMREAPATRMADIVEPLAQALAPLIEASQPSSGRPAGVIVFGHSLGALIGFEVVAALQAKGSPLPAALVVSGRSAPAPHARTLALHTLPDQAFIDEVQRIYGGIPPQILAEPELLALTLPVLRADLEVNETYSYSPRPALSLPLYALGGRDDPHVTRPQLEAWSAHTTGAFTSAQCEGGHFYLGTPAGRRWVIEELLDIARTQIRSRS